MDFRVPCAVALLSASVAAFAAEAAPEPPPTEPTARAQPLPSQAPLAAPATLSDAAAAPCAEPSCPAPPATGPADPGARGYLARPDARAWAEEAATRLGLPLPEIERVLAQARHVAEVAQLIAPPPQPARPRTWNGYRARFVEPVRIAGGLRFWDAHADALERASARYGVPAEVIVAIAGVETVYGRVQGNFRVVDTLATLGFDWPAEAPKDRSAFFREQLAQLVAYAWEQHSDPFALRGSYAGAIGIAQFMPGSLRAYAVDFDDDGAIDLRDNPVDAIGSIANFLAAHGWRRETAITFDARVPETGVDAYIAHDLKPRYTAQELSAAGIHCAFAPAVVADTADAQPLGLIDLASPDAPTEYRCASANFFAITQYNRTFFYAAAVSDLAATLRSAHEALQRRRARALPTH